MLAALLGFILPLGAVVAAEAAVIRLVPPQNLSAMAGERLTFSIVLSVQGQFTGATYFDLPELEGAIVMQDAGRPVLNSEQIAGETYVSARYGFVVYPQWGGSLVVPSIAARFGSRERFDQPTLSHHLKTEAFAIEVKAPPGATPGEVILSTVKLNASETWTPEPQSAKVGDAFTRSITVRAEEVPAMLLPPPRFAAVDGLAMYPEPPQLNDKTGRGELVGERVDSVTYVSERAGAVEIPELSLRWWDPVKSSWQTQRFPAVMLEVEDNPDLAAQTSSDALAERSRFDEKMWIWRLVAAAFVVLALLLSKQRALKAWQGWRMRRASSEPAQWKRLRKACRAGDAAAIYAELGRWLAHFEMSTPELTMARHGGVSDQLRSVCLELQSSLAGIQNTWSPEDFLRELGVLRRHLRLTVDAESGAPLPSINPTRNSAVPVR